MFLLVEFLFISLNRVRDFEDLLRIITNYIVKINIPSNLPFLYIDLYYYKRFTQQFYIIQMVQALQLLTKIIIDIDDTYDTESITDLEIAISTLDELFEDRSQAVAKNIDKILDSFETCLAEHPNVTLITITKLYSVLVDVIGSYPKLGKNNKNRCVRVLRGAANIMIKFPYEIEETWLKPPNGYSQQTHSDQNLQVEKEVLRNIDSLCQTVGRSIISSNFQSIFKEYIEIQTDWRYSYASLMLASQLCGQKIKLEKLHLFVQYAVKYLENPNPKIRYSCFHLIGQYSEQMKPQFQQKYYNFVIPHMIRHLQDPVPRVVSHDLACFTNFFENINEVWNIQSCIGQILPPIINYLKTADSWLKQASISTLTSLATTADAFGPNLTQILQIANEIITTYAGVPQFTQLINQTFQLLSFVLTYQKRIQVQQYIQNYVQLLLNHRHHISSVYFLNAWGRLCYRYDAFVDISTVFPALIQATNQILTDESDEETQAALSSLNFTCRSFKSILFPYAYELFKIAQQAFQDKDRSQTLRERAISIIVKLVVEAYCQAPQAFQFWQQMAKKALQYIIISIQNVNQYFEQLAFLYEALKEIIQKLIHILTPSQIQEIGTKLKAYQSKTQDQYNDLQMRKKQMEATFQGNQVQQDQSQVNLIGQSLTYLADSAQNISQIYQALLNTTNPNVKQSIIAVMLTQASTHIDKTGQWKLFGISLIVTIAQKTKYEQIKDKWANMLTICINHSSHPHTRIRNMAVYGMGLMIEGTPLEFIQQENVMNWLQSLWNSLTVPFTQDLDDRMIQHSTENIVSALGKLLHKCGQKFPIMLNQQIYQHWLSRLPLNKDKEEGNIQQKYLIELLYKNPGIIVSNSDDLKRICIIFASFLSKRYDFTKQIMNQTKIALKTIMNWPLFKDSETYLWNNLTSSQINLLTRFIAN